jgi:hypothetical protein
MPIAVDSHDAKLGGWEELTSGNLFSVRLFKERNRADFFTESPTIAE